LGNKEAGLSLMKAAATMEDSTAKHPVTPGEVLPAGELYADMLMEMKDFKNALKEYNAVLEKSPARFNSLYGAGLAAKKLGMEEKAAGYFKQLPAAAMGERPEMAAVQSYNSNLLAANGKIK
jgi:tetratricopeptide (TPR) repeat protein